MGYQQPTGNNLANILIPGANWALAEISTNVRDKLKWRDYEFYVGDNWKVSRNLTLELASATRSLLTPYQPDDHFTSFSPPFTIRPSRLQMPATAYGSFRALIRAVMRIRSLERTYSSGVNGPNKYLRNQNYHLFAPRLGVAWDPRGDGKTAVRFGIGQFYQRERVSPEQWFGGERSVCR